MSRAEQILIERIKELDSQMTKSQDADWFDVFSRYCELTYLLARIRDCDILYLCYNS